MAIIKCKMCGGDLALIEGQSVAECEYCGTRQTVPTGDSEKKLTLFARANRLRSACEFDKAAGIYESIAAEYPEEAESYWGLVLCRYGIEYVDDPATGKKIPTCHRSSFLSILEDSDFEQAMENADEAALRVYREEAKQIETIRRGILAVSASEKPYDIFLCYKETDSQGNRTVDSLLAQDIYDALTEKGYRVFFSRITLEDKLGQAYEPYIFAALHSAKIMLAVGTCYENYNAVWVKNEWSRYLKLIAQDKGKYLIPCYKNIDAYDIPREFAHLQGQDMGKVGAMADLLRGIEKLLPKQQKTVQVIREPVAVSTAADPSPLLTRAMLFLEDGDWESADRYCEKVLDMEPKNGGAYFCKLLAQYRVRNEEELGRQESSFPENPNYQKALRFGSSAVQEKLENARKDTVYYTALKLLKDKKAPEKQQIREAIARLQTIPGWRDSERLQAECRERIARIEAREESERQERENKARLAREQAEQRKKQAKKNAGKRIRAFKIAAAALCCAVALVLLVNTLVMPLLRGKPEETVPTGTVPALAVPETAPAEPEPTREPLSPEYLAAEELLSRGETAKAAIAFGKLGDYKDARQRSFALWRQVAPPQTICSESNSQVAVKNNGTVLMDHYVDHRQKECLNWTDIVSVATSDALTDGHTVGLKSDGTVVAAGSNQHGQCDTSEWNNIVAIAAGPVHTVGLTAEGRVLYAGAADGDYYTEAIEKLSSWEDIVAITSGWTNVVTGIKADGTVVSTDYNLDHWTDIICVKNTYGNIVGLKADGTVVAEDDNYRGHCNVSDWTDIIAIGVAGDYTMGLKRDGTVVTTDPTGKFEAPDFSGWTDIAAISTGQNPLGIKSDGSVAAAAGDNSAYTTWTDIRLPSPMELPAASAPSVQDPSAAYIEAESLLSQGETAKAAIAFGKLGDYEDARQRSFELWRNVNPPHTLSSIGSNNQGYSTAAVKADGTILLDGYTDSRQSQCLDWTDIISVCTTSALSEAVTLGLKADGTVVAAGSNAHGQCNTSTWNQIVAIGANYQASFGLKSDGTVLYAGTVDDYSEPIVQNISAWRDIVAITCNGWNSNIIGLKCDGTVVFADTVHYEYDLNNWTDIISVAASTGNVVGLKADGTVVAAGPLQYGKYTYDVSEWSGIVAIAAYDGYAIGLKADGTVVCTGYNGRDKDGRPLPPPDVSEWSGITAICAGPAPIGIKADGSAVTAGKTNADIADWKDIKLPR